MRHAGAIPEAFMTAHDAMIVQAGLRPAELVLIHAVASGVGLAAVHLARALGARTFGTTRTPEKLARALALGLDDGMVVGDSLAALADRVRACASVIGAAGANVVLDLLGGPYLAASVDAAAPRARLMLVGAIAGSQATVDVRRILGKRLTLTGTVLRSRSLTEKIAVATAFDRDVVPLLRSGVVAPTIDRVFPLGAIAEAHAHLESDHSVGKVVLDMSDA
jgi:NADPH:quinone reductase